MAQGGVGPGRGPGARAVAATDLPRRRVCDGDTTPRSRQAGFGQGLRALEPTGKGFRYPTSIPAAMSYSPSWDSLQVTLLAAQIGPLSDD